MRGFDALLVFQLARQPTWLLGFACMMAGFAFQVGALRFGPLALVQPILALELLFVFACLGIVWTLSGSALITHTTQPPRPEAGEATNRELTRRSR